MVCSPSIKNEYQYALIEDPVQVLLEMNLEPEVNMPLLAVATGYLTPPPVELVRAPRKQACSLVESEWDQVVRIEQSSH